MKGVRELVLFEGKEEEDETGEKTDLCCGLHSRASAVCLALLLLLPLLPPVKWRRRGAEFWWRTVTTARPTAVSRRRDELLSLTGELAVVAVAVVAVVVAAESPFVDSAAEADGKEREA